MKGVRRKKKQDLIPLCLNILYLYYAGNESGHLQLQSSDKFSLNMEQKPILVVNSLCCCKKGF